MLLATVAKRLPYASVTLAAGDVALRGWRAFALAGTSSEVIRPTVRRAWIAPWTAALLRRAVQARVLEPGVAWGDDAELLRVTA